MALAATTGLARWSYTYDGTGSDVVNALACGDRGLFVGGTIPTTTTVVSIYDRTTRQGFLPLQSTSGGFLIKHDIGSTDGYFRFGSYAVDTFWYLSSGEVLSIATYTPPSTVYNPTYVLMGGYVSAAATLRDTTGTILYTFPAAVSGTIAFVYGFRRVLGTPWLYLIDGGGEDRVRSVCYDTSGNAVIGGFYTAAAATVFKNSANQTLFTFGASTGATAGFVTKIGSDGNHQWSFIIDGTGGDSINAVACDPGGNVYVSGTYAATPSLRSFNGVTTFVTYPAATNSAAFVTKLNPSGTHLWSRIIDGAGADTGTSLAVNGTHVVFGGQLGVGTSIIRDIGGATQATFQAVTVLSGFTVVLNQTTGALVNGYYVTSPASSIVNTVGIDPTGTFVYIGGDYAGSGTSIIRTFNGVTTLVTIQTTGGFPTDGFISKFALTAQTHQWTRIILGSITLNEAITTLTPIGDSVWFGGRYLGSGATLRNESGTTTFVTLRTALSSGSAGVIGLINSDGSTITNIRTFDSSSTATLEQINSIATNSLGDVYVAHNTATPSTCGIFNGTAQICDTPVSTTFVARLDRLPLGRSYITTRKDTGVSTISQTFPFPCPISQDSWYILGDTDVYMNNVLITRPQAPGAVYNNALQRVPVLTGRPLTIDPVNTQVILHIAGLTNYTRYYTSNNVGGVTLNRSIFKFPPGSLELTNGKYIENIPNSLISTSLGSDDFTIEFWFNLTLTSLFTALTNGPYAANGWEVTISGTSVQFRCFNKGTNFQIPGTFLTNTWYHIAIVRQKNGAYGFVNGTLASSDLSYFAGITVDTIGKTIYIGGVSNFYLDDLRITKYARYTRSFQAPTTRSHLQPQGATQQLTTIPAHMGTLLLFDGNVTMDCGPLSLPVSGSGLVYSGSNVVTFGESSSFTATGVPLGKNCTVEFYINLTSSDSTYRRIFTNGGSFFIYSQSGVLYAAVCGCIVSCTVSTGVWYHIAVVWSNSLLSLYVNGLLYDSASDLGTQVTYPSGQFTVSASSGTASNAFDFSNTTVWISASNYNASNIYIGSTTTLLNTGSNIAGEYIDFTLSKPVRITSYSINTSEPYGTVYVVAKNQFETTWKIIHTDQYVSLFANPSVPPGFMTAPSTVLNDGTYIASSDTQYSASFLSWQVFDGATAYYASVQGGFSTTSPFNFIGATTTTVQGIGSVSAAWLQLQCPVPKTISHYSLRVEATNATAFPTEFYLVGSTNGTTWFQLDYRSGISWTVGQTRTFFINQTTYTYFRFLWRRGNGANFIAMDEIRFYSRDPMSIQNKSYYDQYRLIVNRTNGLTYATITEWRLFGTNTFENADFSTYAIGGFLGSLSQFQITARRKYIQTFTPPGTPFMSLEYPPAALTSNITTLTGQTYGNGTYYVLSTSPEFNDGFVGDWKSFDKSIASLSWWQGNLSYNAQGIPLSAYTLTVDGIPLTGEWLQIRLPTPIILRSYTVQAPYYAPYPLFMRAPASWFIIGSMDGVTWSRVDEENDVLYQSDAQILQFHVQTTIAYNHFAILVTSKQPSSTENITGVGEWRLYGTPVVHGVSEYPPTTMSSNISGGYTSSSSSGVAFNAFNKTDVAWTSATGRYSSNLYIGATTTGGVSGEFLRLQFPLSTQVMWYTVFKGALSVAQCPRSWVLMGSTNGTTWSNIHTQTGVTWSTGLQTRLFYVTTTTAYSYYQLVITQNNGDGAVALVEWSLHGTTGTYIQEPAKTPQLLVTYNLHSSIDTEYKIPLYVTSELQAYYDFSLTTSGTTTTDQTRNGYNMTFVGTPTYSALPPSVTVTNSVYTRRVNTPLDLKTNGMSFELVFRVSALNFQFVAQYIDVIDTGTSGFTCQIHPSLVTIYMNVFGTGISGAPGSGLNTGDNTIVVNTWYHAVFTITSGGTWTSYLNNVTRRTGNFGTYNPPTNTSYTLALGGPGNPANNNIGLFRVYSKALTVSEINQNYNLIKTTYGLP
jgi:hypothetical protein